MTRSDERGLPPYIYRMIVDSRTSASALQSATDILGRRQMLNGPWVAKHSAKSTILSFRCEDDRALVLTCL